MFLCGNYFLGLLCADNSIAEFALPIPAPEEFGFGRCFEDVVVVTAIKRVSIAQCQSRRYQIESQINGIVADDFADYDGGIIWVWFDDGQCIRRRNKIFGQ